jgi:hypothetical protein
MAKTGNTAPKRNEQRRLSGMVLELEDEDKARLNELVKRYQEEVGAAFKSTKILVIRQLLRHAAATKTLPPVRPDQTVKSKSKNGERRRLKGMVLELEEVDKTHLEDLVKRYLAVVDPEEFRTTKAFVIRQLLRHAVASKALPPWR